MTGDGNGFFAGGGGQGANGGYNGVAPSAAQNGGKGIVLLRLYV
jgi:hypothetical protein